MYLSKEKLLNFVLGASLLAVMTGCGTKEIESNGTRTISATEYGDEWAFTVPELTLRCHITRGSAVTGTYSGVEYGLNGTANGSGRYAELKTIWKEHPEIEGARVSVGKFIEMGLKLCEY